MVFNAKQTRCEISGFENSGNDAALFFFGGESFDQDEAGGGNEPLSGFRIVENRDGFFTDAGISIVFGTS